MTSRRGLRHLYWVMTRSGSTALGPGYLYEAKLIRAKASTYSMPIPDRIPWVALVRGVLRPTAEGANIQGKHYDAHVRLEDPDTLYIDVFDSRVDDANAAHVESLTFLATEEGKSDLSNYLSELGIDVRVL